jgi:hypothetical protein
MRGRMKHGSIRFQSGFGVMGRYVPCIKRNWIKLEDVNRIDYIGLKKLIFLLKII